MQRSEEHDKAKYMAVKAEEEQQNTTSSITTKTLDKKRRLEEEAKNKVTALEGPPHSCCLLSLWSELRNPDPQECPDKQGPRGCSYSPHL